MDYEELRKKNPERVIDDTDGWEIRKQEKVLFWEKPCEHALEITKDEFGYRAILPLVLMPTVQCYVGATICVYCLFNELDKEK
jgi:hypothetical protein